MNLNRMAGRLSGKLFAAVGVCVGILALSLPASADQFSVQYFQVAVPNTAPENDFYLNGHATTGVITNYVTSTLGPDGLPVFNTSSGVTAPNDLNGAGEIMWWTPSATTGIVSAGSGILNVSSDPSNPTDMFPPDSTGGNDNNAEETALLTGTFDLGSAQNVTFDVGADDDAFVYIDGSLVEDLGGIHAITTLPTTTVDLSAGVHTIEIFYADQQQVAASLAFEDDGIPVSPTPEPSSLALLGTSVLAMGGMLRRRFSR